MKKNQAHLNWGISYKIPDQYPSKPSGETEKLLQRDMTNIRWRGSWNRKWDLGKTNYIQIKYGLNSNVAIWFLSHDKHHVRVPHQRAVSKAGELGVGDTGILCMIFAAFLLIHNYSEINILFRVSLVLKRLGIHPPI